MKKPVSTLEIFAAFFRLGLTAFGGPAMVAYIRELCVKKKGWVAADVFHEGIALVQTVPGATAMQAAAYAGLRAGGPAGALAAYTGFTLPTFIIMLALSMVYEKGRDVPAIVSLFNGLQVIVIALVANAAVNFFRKTIKSWQDILLTLAGAVYIVLAGSPVTVILCSAAAGPFIYHIKDKLPKMPADNKGSGDADLHRQSLLFGLLLCAILAAALAALYVFAGKLFTLACLMLKIDIFAFGGGYASLPLMLHEIVEARHLLDEKTLMDGIALGQVTPGPIVITAAFVGYLLYGVSGSLVATVAIFTPSFLIIILVTPWFDRIKGNDIFQKAMRAIVCSFVGLLIAVAVLFSMAIQWQVLALLICLTAFIALRFRVDILWVVLGGGLLSCFLL